MPSRRTKGISIKVTDDEYATLTRVAAGQPVTAWVHDVVLLTATPRPVDAVLLAEFLALRAIVLTLHFAVAAGETLTAEAMQRLIDQADQDKRVKAEDRLTGRAARRPR